MSFPAVQVFDPPMCCLTGVYGPEGDPALARFAADLKWLEGQGVRVERFTLSREPEVFARTPAVAERIARSLMPAGTKVWSASSRPTRVRPEAIAVLGEIGIDISAHRSRAILEIPAGEVDTASTLCGEEESPLFWTRRGAYTGVCRARQP